MQESELDEQPCMMNSSLTQSHDNPLPCPRLFPMRNLSMIRRNDVFCPEVRHAIQKRRDYDETFNLARKAVRCAVEVGSESLLRLKRSLSDWFIEEQRTADDDDDDKENFNPSQVRNPIEKRHKGRPPVKRFKSSAEQTKKPTGQNKCGKCVGVGHHAPTCEK